MVEFLAARRHPLQQLDGAVDGDVFLVAGDQERDRAFWLAAIVGEILQHRGDAAGDAALHVDRAAAVQQAVLHLAGERAMRPGGFVARRHHVGMAGKGDVRRFSADAGIEIVDVGVPGSPKVTRCTSKPASFRRLRERRARRRRRGLRMGSGRGRGQWRGHQSCPRLTRQTGGGPALCGTISISLCWSQRPAIARRRRRSGSARTGWSCASPAGNTVRQSPTIISTNTIRLAISVRYEFGQPVREHDCRGREARRTAPSTRRSCRGRAAA